MPKSDTLDNGTFKLIETTTRQVILPPSLPKPVLPGEKSELHVLFKPGMCIHVRTYVQASLCHM